MVKRYPHTAVVNMEGEAQLVNGKRVSADSSELVLEGRYEPDGKTVKKNELGKEAVVKGVFYTKTIPGGQGRAVRFRIASLAIDCPVLCLENFQTYSTISL